MRAADIQQLERGIDAYAHVGREDDCDFLARGLYCCLARVVEAGGADDALHTVLDAGVRDAASVPSGRVKSIRQSACARASRSSPMITPLSWPRKARRILADSRRAGVVERHG